MNFPGCYNCLPSYHCNVVELLHMFFKLEKPKAKHEEDSKLTKYTEGSKTETCKGEYHQDSNLSLFSGVLVLA